MAIGRCGLRGPRARRGTARRAPYWWGALALALGLGVVGLLAVAVADAGAPGPTLAGVEERLAHLEGRLEELSRRMSDLQWLVGLGVGWLTAVMAAAVAIILKYR